MMIKLYVFLTESRQGCVGTDKMYEATALGEDGKIIHYEVITHDSAQWSAFQTHAAQLASVVYDGPVEVVDRCEDPEYRVGFKAAVSRRRFKQDEPRRKQAQEAQRGRQQEECIERAVDSFIGRLTGNSGVGESIHFDREGR